MSIKDILNNYQNQSKLSRDDKQEESLNLHETEEKSKEFIEKIINPAFDKLKEEFDRTDRKAVIESKASSYYASVTIYKDNIKEFYYEINLRADENNYWLMLVYHHIKHNGTFYYFPEQELSFNKANEEISEAEIRQDFYNRYQEFMDYKSKNNF